MNAKLTLLCGLAAAMTVQLPACSFSASTETMLTPPRLTAEQEEIYQALQSAAGAQISLKYPKSGERLSAFTVADLDSDGRDEAIVFYETGRSSSEENPLRVCLLDQSGGKWRAVQEYPTAGAEIDRVDIETLGSNPRKNLILRYSMVDGAEHAATVCHYADGALISSLSLSYSMLEVRDLDLDGTTELFMTSAAKAPAAAFATVYALDADGNYIQSPQMDLPDPFTDVTRVSYGILPAENGSSTAAIYLDGMTGATTAQTTVLTYSEHRLSAVYADAADRLNTARSAGCQTMDIDGDGELEIPGSSVFYGYTNAAESSPLNMTNWYVCRNGLLIREHASYYAGKDGYVFVMPQRWEKRVTAVQENEEIVFYEFDPAQQNRDGTPVLLEQLLRLSVVNDPVIADAMQSQGYLLLRQQNGNYYLGAIQNTGTRMQMKESELLFAVQVL